MRLQIIFFAVAALSCLSAHAEVNAGCTSYSGEYDFKISIGAKSAHVDVVRADTTGGAYTLKKGASISLASSNEELNPAWLKFEGVVQGEQTLGLSVNSKDLEHRNFIVHMFISAIDDSSEALALQVDCSQ